MNPEYEFTLIIDGIRDLTEHVLDALFEAGCDDATIGIRHGRFYAAFTREAGSLKDAIFSAIGDVRRADVGAVAFAVELRLLRLLLE